MGEAKEVVNLRKVTSAASNFSLRPGLVSILSENAVQSIVQGSEHHQSLNVSTITVVPGSNSGAHINTVDLG